MDIRKETYAGNPVTYTAKGLDRSPFLLNNLQSMTFSPSLTRKAPFFLVISKQRVSSGESKTRRLIVLKKSVYSGLSYSKAGYLLALG